MVQGRHCTESDGYGPAPQLSLQDDYSTGNHGLDHDIPYFADKLTQGDAFQVIAPSLNVEIIRSDIIEPLLTLAADPIPNIRFNVAKCLEVLATSYAKSPDGLELVKSKVVPVLEQMKNDSDADVRYFATRALQRGLPASGTFIIRPLQPRSLD